MSDITRNIPYTKQPEYIRDKIQGLLTQLGMSHEWLDEDMVVFERKGGGGFAHIKDKVVQMELTFKWWVPGWKKEEYKKSDANDLFPPPPYRKNYGIEISHLPPPPPSGSNQ